MASGPEHDWRSGFDRVYRATAFAVHEHLRGLTRSSSQAWDLTQETFLVYLRYLQKGRRVEKPLGFLYRVSTRLAWRLMRRSRREPTPSAEPPEQPVGPDCRGSEARLLLDRLWPLLGDHCRLVAKLWLADGMGVADICSMSGFKRGRVRRCQKKILKIMSNHGLEDFFSQPGGHISSPAASLPVGGEDKSSKAGKG